MAVLGSTCPAHEQTAQARVKEASILPRSRRRGRVVRRSRWPDGARTARGPACMLISPAGRAQQKPHAHTEAAPHVGSLQASEHSLRPGIAEVEQDETNRPQGTRSLNSLVARFRRDEARPVQNHRYAVCPTHLRLIKADLLVRKANI